MARKGSGESSSGVSKEEFDRLMSSMNDIKEQMSTWRKELSDESEAADERLVKKTKEFSSSGSRMRNSTSLTRQI